MTAISLNQVVIINNLEELLAALRTNSEIITTPPTAIFYMGLLYIEHMVELASHTYPEVYKKFLLNVQDDAAICHLALKGKIRNILFTGNNIIYKKLKNLAASAQITLYLNN
jgi:hypothetical protein